MKRRVGHNDTPDRDRGEPRNGGQRAGPANLDLDLLKPRPCQFGGEFMRDGPSRRRRPETKPLLQRQIVEFVNHAINVIAKRGPRLFDCGVMRQKLIRALAASGEVIGLKPQIGEPFNRLHLGIG